MAAIYFVHESSIVDRPCDIGEGTKIWHFCHVQSGSKIGRNCVLGQNVNIGNNVMIGDGVKIQNNVSVYEGVTLENYVFCGPSVVFTNVLRPRSKYPQPSTDAYAKTIVREGATLGANCTIRAGIEIGRWALIGAGAVVTKHVADFELIVGVPGRRIGWVSEHAENLEFDAGGMATCPRSNQRYCLHNGSVTPIC